MDSKLCPRQTTRFKRSCSHHDSKTTSTSLALREETMFNEAYELSTLATLKSAYSITAVTRNSPRHGPRTKPK
ncbi:unnamed protein product [Arabis nemorensis]|uniref:Uncharacterized protein n=1 Tax=Arabis nemorensis TaxID=586526 RepID=A0A565CNI8_9BRAS|nr:unnamed protein product [Arabis nemorensis]